MPQTEPYHFHFYSDTPVIGVIRQKLSILHSTLPISIIASSDDDGISFIEEIVNICCALCNCCNSVAPFSGVARKKN